jgi:uncharacterized protein (TIRG00374 family)
MKRGLLALLSALAFGLIGISLVEEPADIRTHLQNLPAVSLPLAVTICAASAIYWLIPGLRLQALAAVQGHGLPFSMGLLIHLTGMLSAAITPGGSGSAPAIVAGLRRAGLPLGAALGVSVQVMVLDLIFFVWALPLSLGYLLLTGAQGLAPDLALLTIASFVVSLLAAVLLGRQPRSMARLLLWLAHRRRLARFRKRLTATARGYYRSGRLFLAVGPLEWIYLQALSALAWTGMFLLFWALARIYQPLDVMATLATLTLANLLAMIAPTPGGSGFIEVAVNHGLNARDANAELAVPLLLWRSATFYLVFLLGPLAGLRLFAARRHGMP